MTIEHVDFLLQVLTCLAVPLHVDTDTARLTRLTTSTCNRKLTPAEVTSKPKVASLQGFAHQTCEQQQQILMQ